ncbi:hypothetical protein [Amycolatopsis sp. cmx-4-54]|uniref:hypothetical protein n=1 Tax=Amycolatopsis sp. cmx-4-54 TaxID=2790936 RepID=UPI00397BFF5B
MGHTSTVTPPERRLCPLRTRRPPHHEHAGSHRRAHGPSSVHAEAAPEQIARYAHDAGLRGDGLTTAVAVALAEFGGNTCAHNATPPDNSYGLGRSTCWAASGRSGGRRFGLDVNTHARTATPESVHVRHRCGSSPPPGIPTGPLLSTACVIGPTRRRGS